TILGVSSVAPEVMQATARAASAFVEIDALVEKTGELVSRYTGKAGSSDIVNVEQCPVLAPQLAALLPRIRACLASLHGTRHLG
ncbi:hypothetical protein ONK27_28355, partial [Salmonella enterica subsp. enterica serovar Virginia]|nr:hypothetical protein [Salmonella enterica subsp. enterica serovar Virginia]